MGKIHPSIRCNTSRFLITATPLRLLQARFGAIFPYWVKEVD